MTTEHLNLRKVILWIIALVTIAFLVYRLMTFSQWKDLSTLGKSLLGNNYLYLTILLPFLNIFLESKKWQTLLNPTIRISSKDSIKSVLSGVSTGILTPSGIGEIGGRVLPYTTQNLSYSSAMFVVGSLFQTTITVGLGLLSLLFINISGQSNIVLTILGWLTLAALVVLAIIYGVTRRNSSDYMAEKATHYMSLILSCSLKKLIQVGTISLIRYAIYTTQLYIVLLMLNPDIQILTTIPLIAFFYFGITFLPGFLIADLGIRGSLAIFIFGSLEATTAQILVPIFLVWTLNNCLPAVIGLWFLVKQK